MLNVNRIIQVKTLLESNKEIHNKIGIIKGIYGNKFNPSYFDVMINGHSYMLLKNEIKPL